MPGSLSKAIGWNVEICDVVQASKNNTDYTDLDTDCTESRSDAVRAATLANP